MSRDINVNPNFNAAGRKHAEGDGEALTPETDKRLFAPQKGKGTRAIAGGMRGKARKK